MVNKDAIINALEDAGLISIEMIQEDEGMALVRFYYDFDQEELDAAQSFAESEEEDLLEEDLEEISLDEVLDEEELLAEDDEDLTYDEDDEYYDDPRLKYLSEIAIDHVGEILEELRDDLDLEVQYVGYDPTEDDYSAYEFVAVIFDKNKALNIEEILDELDI